MIGTLPTRPCLSTNRLHELQKPEGPEEGKGPGHPAELNEGPLGVEEVDILKDCIEPGMESFEDKMTEKVFNLGKDIIMKDQRAKIFVGEDLNLLLNRM